MCDSVYFKGGLENLHSKSHLAKDWFGDQNISTAYNGFMTWSILHEHSCNRLVDYTASSRSSGR